MSVAILKNMIPGRNLISVREKSRKGNYKDFLRNELYFVPDEEVDKNKMLEINCKGQKIIVPIKKTKTTIGHRSLLARFDVKLDIANHIFLVLVCYRGFWFLLDASGQEKPCIISNNKPSWSHELRKKTKIVIDGENTSIKLTTQEFASTEDIELVPIARNVINGEAPIVELERQFLLWQQDVLKLCIRENNLDLWEEILIALAKNNFIRADFVAIDFKIDNVRTKVKESLNENCNKSQQISGRAVSEMRQVNETVIYGGGFEGSASLSYIKECLLSPIWYKKLLFTLDVEVLHDKEKFKQTLRCEFAKKGIALAKEFFLYEDELWIVLDSGQDTFYIYKNVELLEIYAQQTEMVGILYFHLGSDNNSNFSAANKEYAEKMANLLAIIIEQQRQRAKEKDVYQQVLQVATLEPLKIASSNIALFQLEDNSTRLSLLAGRMCPAVMKKFADYGIEIKTEHVQIKTLAEKCVNECILTDYYNNREYYCAFEGNNTFVYSSLFGAYNHENIFSNIREYNIIAHSKKGQYLNGDSISVMNTGDHVDPKLYLFMFDAQGHSLTSLVYNIEARSIAEAYARSGIAPTEIMARVNEHLYHKYRHRSFGTKQFTEGLIMSLENMYEEEEIEGDSDVIPIYEKKKIEIAASGLACIYAVWMPTANRYLLVDVSKENLSEAKRKGESLCIVDYEMEQTVSKISSKVRILNVLLKGTGITLSKDLEEHIKVGNTDEAQNEINDILQMLGIDISKEQTEDIWNILNEIAMLIEKLSQLKKKKEDSNNLFQGSLLGCQPPEQYIPSSCLHTLQEEDFIFAVSDGYSTAISNVVIFLNKWLEENKNKVENGEKLVHDFIKIAKEKGFAIEKDDATLLFVKRNNMFPLG